MKRHTVLLSFALAILFAPPSALPGENSQSTSQPDAAEDYLLHCSAWHTDSGAGVPGMVPSLLELAPLLEHARGREYLVRVPGVAQAPLSDARIARLLNWVLENYSSRRLDPPFEAGEVARFRSSPLRDPVGFRAGLSAHGDNTPLLGSD